jgi:hypothetical protein
LMDRVVRYQIVSKEKGLEEEDKFRKNRHYRKLDCFRQLFNFCWLFSKPLEEINFNFC